MKVDGKHLRTIWPEAEGFSVRIIDQTRLPHEFVTARLETLEDAVHAIRAMQVRGAPLIGATAATRSGAQVALQLGAAHVERSAKLDVRFPRAQPDFVAEHDVHVVEPGILHSIPVKGILQDNLLLGDIGLGDQEIFLA